MEKHTYWPDLTELHGLSAKGYYDKHDNYVKQPFADHLKEIEAKIETEFVFCVTGEYQIGSGYNSVEKELRAAGYKPVACKLNWYPSHGGDRPLVIWFKTLCPGRLTGKLEPRERYDTVYDGYKVGDLVRSACGAKLLDGLTRLSHVNKYVALARLPLDIPKTYLKGLKRRSFRHVATGTIAQYWANGWTLEEYPGRDKEIDLYDKNVLHPGALNATYSPAVVRLTPAHA